MMKTMQVNGVRNVFRVQIVREEAEVPELQQKQRKMQAIHPAAAAEGAGDGEAAEETGSSAFGDAADGGRDQGGKKVETVRRAEPRSAATIPARAGAARSTRSATAAPTPKRRCKRSATGRARHPRCL